MFNFTAVNDIQASIACSANIHCIWTRVQLRHERTGKAIHRRTRQPTGFRMKSYS